MGPDEYSDADYLQEIKNTNKDWFLGSEVHLWNTAIKQNLPNLERIIKTPDHQYKGHRLKMQKEEKSDSEKFYVSHFNFSFMKSSKI